MKVLGLKYSHDAAVTLIEDDNLIFHVELEKIKNNKRYTKGHENMASEVLSMYGMDLNNIDQVVVDGWHNGKDSLGNDVAPYAGIDTDLTAIRLHESYVSYPHILTHIIGAYATSPFSKDREPAYCITWDGRQVPRIDFVNPAFNTPVKYVGLMFPLSGLIYGIMGYYFGPFKNQKVIDGELNHSNATPLLYYYDIPGKLMSYIALGNFDYELYGRMWHLLDNVTIYASHRGIENMTKNYQGFLEHMFMKMLMEEIKNLAHNGKEYSDATVLNTIHIMLEQKLVQGVKSIIPRGANLIFTGGSALNIKWNSAIAKMGHVNDIWVPPFPNDCGNSLGAAATYRAIQLGMWSLDWSVYSGPSLVNKPNMNVWHMKEMTPHDLGVFIAKNVDAPVVVLNGNAEIGPRALGHRSIIMNASKAENKIVLNVMKQRESFRPVAPIALQEDAIKAFHLVKQDPYMLYDHEVCKDWQDIIPAVVHVDGTARVQTVDKTGSQFVREMLLGHKEIAGYGIVCNTSANNKGRGFFPDLVSAMTWADSVGCDHIWLDGILYTHPKAST